MPIWRGAIFPGPHPDWGPGERRMIEARSPCVNDSQEHGRRPALAGSLEPPAGVRIRQGIIDVTAVTLTAEDATPLPIRCDRVHRRA